MVVKSTGYFFKGPGFNSQLLHGGSQLSQMDEMCVCVMCVHMKSDYCMFVFICGWQTTDLTDVEGRKVAGRLGTDD